MLSSAVPTEVQCAHAPRNVRQRQPPCSSPHAALAAHRPLILFELNDLAPGASIASSPCASYLSALGYEFFGLHWSGTLTQLIPIASDDDPHAYREPWQALNVVALHRDNALARELIVMRPKRVTHHG